MRVPEALEPLVDCGLVQEVIRPLMSGKEAQIYLVHAGGIECVAKVYKEAVHRSFKHRADYTEGRKVRDTRSQRAMERGSKFGKKQSEDSWRSAEVDAIYRLRDAGVRVPEPYEFVDGVLLMELISSADGTPAPRLADVALTEEEALWVFDTLLRDVVKMLCAGIIHGDLSDFNVLIAHDGPVIIDFPQATDPARNQSARKLLVRDVDNLTSFLARFAPELKGLQFGEEMWELYERGELAPGTALTGQFKRKRGDANVSALLREIEEVEREARQRREALGLEPARPARTPVISQDPPRFADARGKGRGGGGGDRQGGRGGGDRQGGRGGGGGGGGGQDRRDGRPRGGPGQGPGPRPDRRDQDRRDQDRRDRGPSGGGGGGGGERRDRPRDDIDDLLIFDD